MAGLPRRPAARWLISVLAALVALDLGLGIGAVVLSSQAVRVAPARAVVPRARPAPPDPGVVVPRASGDLRVDAIRRLLDARADALLRRNRTAFLATVDPADPSFFAAQAKLFDDLAAVPLGSWRYSVDPDTVHSTTATRFAHYNAPLWAPTVTLHYTLTGFDQQPTSDAQYLTFVRRTSGWLIGADDDFADIGLHTVRGLWDFAPVQVVQGSRSLVLGHPGSHRLLVQLANEVDSAVPRVTAVWGTDWSQRVVMLVPDSQDELSRLVGDGSDLTQIAAVATAELTGAPESRVAVGDRILINPPNFALLGALGRRVVLTHEVTHVATRSASGPDEPTWLVEGIADYIGYLGTGVPVDSAARELADDVRRGASPTALPSDAAFAGSNQSLPQVYEQSWLAVRAIVARGGEAGLLRLYRVIGAAPPGQPRQSVERAFVSVLGITLGAFTAVWRASLRAQLS